VKAPVFKAQPSSHFGVDTSKEFLPRRIPDAQDGGADCGIRGKGPDFSAEDDLLLRPVAELPL